MKKITVLLYILLYSITSSAYNLGIGIKAGLNISSFYGRQETNEINRWKVNPYSDQIPNPNFTFDFDLFYNITRHFGLQTEIKITKKGQKEKGNVLVNGNFVTSHPDLAYSSKFDIPYIEFPLLLKMYIPLKLIKISFYSGCAFDIKYRKIEYQYSSEYNSLTSNMIDTIDNEIRKFNFGIPIGTNLEIKTGPDAIIIDFRYQLGLINVNKSSSYIDKIKNTEFTIGYMYYFQKQ